MKNSLLSERSSSFALEQEIQTLLEQSSHPHQREDQHQGSLSSLLLKMRKYYKLVLVVVTVVSLVCFLFYKTQYDKLYNVLQVLEFFGDPGSSNG